jgi:hypothetical protein
MRTLNWSSKDVTPEAKIGVGIEVDESHYDEVIDEDFTLNVDEQPYVVLAKRHVADDICADAFKAFWLARGKPENRGGALGLPMENTLKVDGTLSKMRKVQPQVMENVGWADFFGYMEGATSRNNANPSATSFTFWLHEKHPEAEAALIKYGQAADAVFAQYMPERHAAQIALAKQTPGFVIPGTSFTTILGNKSVPEKQMRFVTHSDPGDYLEGYGLMGGLVSGDLHGFHLVVMGIRKAFRVRTGDVLLYPINRLHGNTKPSGSGWARISAVCYYRTEIARQLGVSLGI